MTNFELTLHNLSNLIQPRIRPEFLKIRVQGNNRPNSTTLLFTIFTKSGYQMEFLTVKNFRNYRPEGNLEEEMILLNRQVESFRSVLENYINYE
jgi:hypothetical protein